jgi:hypothetical protein
MANKVIRYLLEGNGTVPAFVQDGGYFPVGNELIGLSVDEDKLHVPDTVVRLNRAELLARVTLALKDEEGNFKVKMNPHEPVDPENVYTEEDAELEMEAWLERMGIPDLQ